MLYERTLGQWLEHWAETTPDKEYIVYSDRNLRFTWSQFNRRVDDMAKGLISIGWNAAPMWVYGPLMYPTGLLFCMPVPK